jgi:hypothetical protein
MLIGVRTNLHGSHIRLWCGLILSARLRLCFSGIDELISLLDYYPKAAAGEFFLRNIPR